MRFTIRDLIYWTFIAALVAFCIGVYLAPRRRPPLIFTDPPSPDTDTASLRNQK